jgi:hypothetical protein
MIRRTDLTILFRSNPPPSLLFILLLFILLIRLESSPSPSSQCSAVPTTASASSSSSSFLHFPSDIFIVCSLPCVYFFIISSLRQSCLSSSSIVAQHLLFLLRFDLFLLRFDLFLLRFDLFLLRFDLFLLRFDLFLLRFDAVLLRYTRCKCISSLHQCLLSSRITDYPTRCITEYLQSITSIRVSSSECLN